MNPRAGTRPFFAELGTQVLLALAIGLAASLLLAGAVLLLAGAA